MLLEAPYFLTFLMIVILIELINHYGRYDVVEAVCVEFTSRRGYQGQKYYPATYEYEIDGKKYSTYAKALWKPKAGELCRIFVHKKYRYKIEPYENMVGIIRLAVIGSIIFTGVIIYGLLSGYYAKFW